MDETAISMNCPKKTCENKSEEKQDGAHEMILLKLSKINEKLDVNMSRVLKKMNDIKMEFQNDVKELKTKVDEETAEMNTKMEEEKKEMENLKKKGLVDAKAIFCLLKLMDTLKDELKEMKQRITKMESAAREMKLEESDHSLPKKTQPISKIDEETSFMEQMFRGAGMPNPLYYDKGGKFRKNKVFLPQIQLVEDAQKINEKFEVSLKEMDEKLNDIIMEIVEINSSRRSFEEQTKEMDYLRKSGEMNERTISGLFTKMNVLSEETKDQLEEARSNQELRLIEVHEKLSEATETCFSVVQSLLEKREVKEDVEKKMADSVKKQDEKILHLNQKMEMLISEVTQNVLSHESLKTQMIDQFQYLRVKHQIEMENVNKNCSHNQTALRIRQRMLEEDVRGREYLEAMEENEIHRQISYLEIAIHGLNPQMNSFTLINRYDEFRPSLSWKIDGIEELMTKKDETFDVTSDEFQLTGYPLRARANFQLKDDGNVYMSLRFEDAKKEINSNVNKDEDLIKDEGAKKNVNKVEIDLKCIPQLFFLLKDRSSSNNRQHRCHDMKYLLGSSFQSSLTFERLLMDKFYLTHPSYNVDDCLMVEVFVEPPTVAKQVQSYNGVLHWAMDQFSERRRAEEKGLVWCQESPYFYSGPTGYRLRAYVWLNGNKDHYCERMSVVIGFLAGEFDAQLPSTFLLRITVTIMNRKHPRHSISNTIEGNFDRNKALAVDLGSVAEIEKVVDNDTLFWNIAVNVL